MRTPLFAASLLWALAPSPSSAQMLQEIVNSGGVVGGAALAFPTLPNGFVSSTIAGSGTYTGSPISITTATWGGATCTGSSTVTGFSASSGAWSATFGTPASPCTGTIAITDNRSDTATSPSVTIGTNCGISGPWTCIAHAQVAPSGTTGGTVSNVNCASANLIVLNVTGVGTAGVSTLVSVSDSVNGATYTRLGYSPSTGPGAAQTILYYLTSPTVSTSMSFTVSGSSAFYGTMDVQCFHDTSGTPSYDTPNSNGAYSSTGSATEQAGSITPSVNNALLVATIANNVTPSTTMSINSSFTITDQNAQIGGQVVQSGMAWYVQPTAAAINPTWSVSAATNAGMAIMAFKP